MLNNRLTLTHTHYEAARTRDLFIVVRPSDLWYYKPDTPVWQGELFTGFHGCTYGCITSEGIALTNGDGGFFEAPRDAVRRLTLEEVV